MSADTFNWHDSDVDEFRKWLFVSAMGDSRADDGKWRQIYDATDRGNNVEITMQINGIEVDTQHLINRIHDNMKHYSQQYAREMVDEITDGDDMYQLLRELKQHIRNKLRAAGIEVYDD